MPHLQIEVSAGLARSTDLRKMAQVLADELSGCPTIDPSAVKAYVRVAEVYATGEGARPEFVHVTVCLLDGRDEEALSLIADRLAAALDHLFAAALADGTAGRTVEVRQMARAAYRK
jgi:5-carboxymethyl-2-hydroxymuconate isomerase